MKNILLYKLLAVLILVSPPARKLLPNLLRLRPLLRPKPLRLNSQGS